MTKYDAELTVSVSELAGGLSAVLAEVEAGRRIVVTRRGVPVAMLCPPAAAGAEGGYVAEEPRAAYAVAEPGAKSRPAVTALTRLIGTPAMRAVMSIFLTDAAAVTHQREIARRAGIGLRSAQIALTRLVALGLLAAERDGNRLYYRAVRGERFEGLRALMAREVGVVEIIARHLSAMPVPITRAFIFGSMAAGKDTLSSDIDLLVVSDASADDLVGPIAAAQRELGREIDLLHYREAEFARRRAHDNHFVETIVSQPRIDVIGGPDDA